jgi:fructose-1-phosphate kinase PfkB-like protein
VTLHAVIDENFTVAGFAKARTQRASLAEAFPVGKGISCGNALAGLGSAADTTVLVLCGHEDTQLYASALAPRNFQAVRVIGGATTTRRHVTVIDPMSAEPVTHIQVPGIPHPPALFKPRGAVTAAVEDIATGGGLVALSGSLPMGAPVGFYADLVRAVAAVGGRAVLDTSGLAFAEALRAGPFAIKPNRAEAEALLGRKLGDAPSVHAAAAAEIRAAHGVEWVVLSDGAAGLVVVGAAGAWHCCVRLAAEDAAGIVNDQGCGDSLVAGFLATFADAAKAGVEVDPVVLGRRMVLAATANLFTAVPGELSAPHIAAFGSGDAIQVVEIQTGKW